MMVVGLSDRTRWLGVPVVAGVGDQIADGAESVAGPKNGGATAHPRASTYR
jgi:hypothetical protein